MFGYTINNPFSAPLLQRGSQGEQVAFLQNLLNMIGNHQLTVDGKYGWRTEAAVREYQEHRNLDVDGIVGNNTWTQLYKDIMALNTGKAYGVVYNGTKYPNTILVPEVPEHVVKYATIPKYSDKVIDNGVAARLLRQKSIWELLNQGSFLNINYSTWLIVGGFSLLLILTSRPEKVKYRYVRRKKRRR